MWVVYHKKGRKIVGMSAHSEVELDKEFAVKEVVTGLVSPDKPEEYDAIQVKDRDKAVEYINAFPDKLTLKGTKDMLQLVIEQPKLFFLVLKTDAPDVHPVDSIPEIPADGKSFTKITVMKIDEQGAHQRAKNDNDLLYLRTDYGTLRDASGANEINSIKLNKGEAAFRLYSEKSKRVATIQVFNADSNLMDARISIEFI